MTAPTAEAAEATTEPEPECMWCHRKAGQARLQRTGLAWSCEDVRECEKRDSAADLG